MKNLSKGTFLMIQASTEVKGQGNIIMKIYVLCIDWFYYIYLKPID